MKNLVLWKIQILQVGFDQQEAIQDNLISAKDTPTTARQSVYSLHAKYLREAGARHHGDGKNIVEISPLKSYSGEGLEEYEGKEIVTPIVIS